MLPARNRLRHAAEFRAVMRSGARKGRQSVVVYALAHSPTPDRGSGPRFGLVVSKAVGNSVQRHGMSRRLRHICANLDVAEYFDIDFVVRALPAATALGAAELERDVLGAARAAAAKAVERRDGVGGASARGSSSTRRGEEP